MIDRSTLERKRALTGESEAALAAGDVVGAMRLKEQAMSLGRPSPADLYALGKLQNAAMRYDSARKTFGTLLALAPTVPEIAAEVGRLARIGGDFTHARQVLDPALQKHPTHPNLLCERLEAGQAPTELVARCEDLAAAPSIASTSRQLLAFALATYFDEAQDPSKAWHFATLGNNLYNDEGTSLTETENQIKKAFELFQKTATLTAQETSPRLGYLIGPPRSGGTLLLSVLAAPPGHTSLGERGALLPWIFSTLGSDAKAEWAQAAHRTREADLAGVKGLAGSSSFVFDKTPHHAHVAGLVAKLHQQAVFIEQRRNLEDTLVSIYLQGFKPAFGYTRSVRSIADYLVLHHQTINHWQSLGIKIIRHDHERFVRDPEKEGSSLFGKLGLTWSGNFLQSTNRAGDFRTFSAASVRDEISPNRTQKAEKYREFLGTLPDRFRSLVGQG